MGRNYEGIERDKEDYPTTKNISHLEFTWDEFLTRVTTNGPSIASKGGRGNSDWAGGTYKQALEMATDKGYTSAIAEAEARVAAIETDIGEGMNSSFQAVHDTAGAEVDIARFLAGEPECMIESTPIKVMRTGRVIKVAVPVCYPSTIDPQTVLDRGAAIMALVDAFSRMQHPVEIWAGCAIHDSHHSTPRKRLVYMVKVQSADQPLDMGRIMYALAHPTMLRQLFFSAEEQEPPAHHRTFSIGSGYGTAPYDLRPSDFTDTDVHNVIILPPLMSNGGWNVDQSARWIEQELRRVTDNY